MGPVDLEADTAADALAGGGAAALLEAGWSERAAAGALAPSPRVTPAGPPRVDIPSSLMTPTSGYQGARVRPHLLYTFRKGKELPE